MAALSFDERVQKAIPATWHMISGSADSQTSADVYNVSQFQLPNPAGKSGGACTSAFLEVLYKDQTIPVEQLSWVTVLKQMRQVLRNLGYDQIPQLTASRLIDVNEPLYICPSTNKGKKRALLMGINYIGQKNGLTGCHNDVENIQKYLEEVHGFEERNMLIFLDDGMHHSPTRKNILDAFDRLVQYSRPGDAVFIHYSGHGSRVQKINGGGYDDTIVPVDFVSSGQILASEILTKLVKPMCRGVSAAVLMDCCHSGTVLDLPYIFKADDDDEEDHIMRQDKSFDLDKFVGTAEAVVCCTCLGLLFACLFSR